jgi:ADP-ribose pyrophosphatase
MNETEQDIEILDKEIVYQGFFQLERYRLRHRLYAGGMSGIVTRELLERGHAAAVLPYDPRRDEILLIEQFRIGALEMPGGAWLQEIVAGIIDPGESAQQVVMREAQEEAGCVIEALEPIFHYLVSPGGTSEQISLFCGKVNTANAGGLFGLDTEHEDIRATVVSFEAAMRRLAEGGILSATPIIALQWLAANRERLRAQWA